MKVKELIDILKSKDPEARVVVNGYEQGYADLASLRDLPLKLNHNTEDYNGPHEQAENGEEDEVAVLIPRGGNPLAK